MNEQPIVNGDGKLIAELARKATEFVGKPHGTNALDAAAYVILKGEDGNERVEWLKELRDPPHRKTGTVKLNDADSFLAYYAIHGNGAPVYATMEPARFVAVLNEHTKDAAGWRDHRADFTVKHSREWTVWTKHNGQGAAFGSNEAFALFLEDNAPDIIKPDSASMLSIALNFRVNADVSFAVAQRLQDGQVELGYNNIVSATAQSTAGGKLKIPEIFTLEMPVFDGPASPKYRLEARFRYRLREGKLTLWYELVRPHKVVEQAFLELWRAIAKGTKAPILHGTPE